MSEPTYCAYEHCRQPLEVIPGGHRRREYCNDTCRQAAHRLRKQREQRQQHAGMNPIWTKYQSPRLCALLERVRREQGETALRRLMVAIDEELWHTQGHIDSAAQSTELAQEGEQRLLRYIDTLERELVRLSDDELEQGRLWVAQKTGVPVIATRLPIEPNVTVRARND